MTSDLIPNTVFWWVTARLHMQHFRLRASKVYSLVSQTLAQQRRTRHIEQLLECVRSSGLRDAGGWDDILNACINVLADDRREVSVICNTFSIQAIATSCAISSLRTLKSLLTS